MIKENLQKSVSKVAKDWDELASLDPLFFVLTTRGKQGGQWDVQEFFSTGEQEIARLLSFAESYHRPAAWNKAVDFGCGVGRLTRALSTRFAQCWGVDGSEKMVLLAKQLNNDFANCEFVVNHSDKLPMFPNDTLDMICSEIVLQHLPSRDLIRSYILEFVRILGRDGLLVFQVPSYIPFQDRLQPRRRLYNLLRSLGLSEDILYRKIRLTPMSMMNLPETEVLSILKNAGARVLDVTSEKMAGKSLESRTYYVTK